MCTVAAEVYIYEYLSKIFTAIGAEFSLDRLQAGEWRC